MLDWAAGEMAVVNSALIMCDDRGRFATDRIGFVFVLELELSRKEHCHVRGSY